MKTQNAREARPMTPDRHMQIDHLKTSVQRASYVVDPRAVAEAMLRRAAEERAARLLVRPRTA